MMIHDLFIKVSYSLIEFPYPERELTGNADVASMNNECF